MHINLRKLLCFFLFIGIGSTLFAQSFVLKNYSTNDGLPSSEAYFSVQDDDGYMWFATDKGLCKFDGYKFTTYTTESGLEDNTNFELIKDKKGRLWFKGFSTKMGYIKNDSIHAYKYNALINKIAAFRLLNNVIIDDEDNLWFTNYNRLKSNLFERCFLTKISANGEIDTSFNNIKKGKKSVYLQSNGRGVVSGDINATQTTFYLLNSKQKVATVKHSSAVAGVESTRLNNDYFIASLGNSVFRFGKKGVEKITTIKSEVINLFVDKDENIWIGYRDKGYEYLSAKSNYTKRISALSGETISSISQDNEGGIWLTSLEKGVYYIASQTSIVYLNKPNYRINKIYDIVQIQNGVVATGDGRKVYFKENGTNTFKLFFNKANYRNAIHYSKEGRLYTNFSSHSPLKPPPSVIKDCQKIEEGENFSWAINQQLIKKISKTGKQVDSISFDSLSRIWCVFEKAENELLIGTLLGLYHYKNGKTIALNTINPLYNHRISDIIRVDKNHVLAATIGGGILLINENDFRGVTQYKEKEGLPSIMCNKALKANDTTLLIATNKGICIINNILDSKKTKFKTLDVSNGLVANEVNNITKINNEYWLATVGGISVVNSDATFNTISTVPTYIRDVTINGKVLPKIEPVDIKYSDNNITISFIGINFQYSNALKYKYRLKNIDATWNYTQNLSVVYSSLPSGKYTFEVSVITPNGKQNPVLASYSFAILPPFWQTPWFISLVVLASLFIAFLFIRYRIAFVREQERLKHDLRVFRDRALRKQMNPHFIYNSLNAIQNYILKHRIEASATFLSKFSSLMRLTFNNTAEELVTLEKEIEALVIYAELENLRFNQKFKFHINIHEGIDRNKTKVPPLIIQPFVENAIQHGLVSKEDKGNIWVNIKVEHNSLEVFIKDDGIGIQNAQKIADRKARFMPAGAQKSKRHSGVRTTRARIQQQWGKNYKEEYFKIINIKQHNTIETGTLVVFYLPTYD